MSTKNSKTKLTLLNTPTATRSIRLAIATIFIFSVISKLYSFTDFINFTSHYLNTNEYISQKLCTCLIGIEFYIGISFLTNDTSKWLKLSTLGLLIFFTLFSIEMLITNYNDNCHCFGTLLPFTPLETILKNLIIMLLFFLSLKNTPPSSSKQSIFHQILTILIISLAIKEPTDFFRKQAPSISIGKLNVLKKYTLIDVRPNFIFTKKHIPEAINIPYRHGKKIPESLKNLLTTHPPNEIIIVYCDSKICNLAKHLARILKDKYKENTIYYLKGGFETWENESHSPIY